MTRNEAVAYIQQQLGFATGYSDTIISNLQLAQTMLENGPTKPWFLVSEDSYKRTSVDEQRIALPSDFLEETDEAVLRYVPDDLTEASEVDLVKDYYDVLRKNYMDADTGTIETGPPEAYALVGNYFRLFPVPDDLYLIRMVYYKRDTALTSNVENGWLKWNPYVLMGVAGFQVASALRDSSAMAVFREWEKQGRVLLMSQNITREMGNMDMQIGGPH